MFVVKKKDSMSYYNRKERHSFRKQDFSFEPSFKDKDDTMITKCIYVYINNVFINEIHMYMYIH